MIQAKQKVNREASQHDFDILKNKLYQTKLRFICCLGSSIMSWYQVKSRGEKQNQLQMLKLKINGNILIFIHD